MHIDDHLLLAPGRAHVLQRVILALAFLLFFLQSALCSSSLGILWPKTAANEELSIVVELASAEHGLSRGNLLWRKDGEEVEVAISRMQELASDIVGFIGPRGSDEARFAARAAVLPVVSPTVTASFLEDDLGLFRRSPLSGAGQEEEAFTAFVTGLGHPSAAVLFQKDSTWASDMALVLITKGVEAGLRVFPCPLKHFRAVNDLAISSLQAHTARICLGSETFCEDLIGFVQDLKIKLNGGGRAMWIVQEAPNVYRSKAWLADVTLFGVMPDVGEPTAAWYRLAGKLGGQVPSWKQAASYDYASVLLQAAAEDQDLCVNKETGYYNSTCVLNNFDRLARNRPDQTFQHQAASFALLMATTDGSKEVGNYNPSADQLELRHELINKLSKPHDIERYLAQRRVSSYNRRASWSPEEHLAGKTFAVGVGMGVFPLSNPRSPTNIICDNSTKRCECGRTSPMIFTSCDAIVQPDNGKNGDPLDWCVIQKFIDNFKCKGSAGSPLFNIEVVELPCDNKDPATCAFYYGTTPPNLVLSSSWSDWVCSYFGRITDPHETAVRKNLETLGLRQPDIAFGKLANTLTIEMDRIECGMQFPKPLMTYGDKIYVAKSNDKSNLEAWSSPFDYDLWFWFLLSLLMAPLILWSVDTNHEEGAEGWVQVVFVTLMSILGTTSFDARRAFGRLLEVSWVLLLFFCTAFYNANLTAKIVKPTTVTLVRGFSDITPEKRLCLAGRYADPKSTLQRRVRRRLKEQSSENIKLKPLLQDLESICRCWCEREHTVDECQECCESTKAQCSKITVKDQQGAFKECNKQEYRIHLIFADPGNSSSAVEVGTVAEKILDINDEDKCQAGLGYDYEITRFFSDNSNLCSDLTVLPDYSWPVSHKSIAFGYHLPKDDVLALSYVVSHLTTDEEAALAYKKWMIKSFNRGPIGGPDENLPLCGSGAACGDQSQSDTEEDAETVHRVTFQQLRLWFWIFWIFCILLTSSELIVFIIRFQFIATSTRWLLVDDKPKEGHELSNTRLALALASKTEFTHEEVNDFGIDGLRTDHYIKVGTSYFRPAAIKIATWDQCGQKLLANRSRLIPLVLSLTLAVFSLVVSSVLGDQSLAQMGLADSRDNTHLREWVVLGSLLAVAFLFCLYKIYSRIARWNLDRIQRPEPHLSTDGTSNLAAATRPDAANATLGWRQQMIETFIPGDARGALERQESSSSLYPPTPYSRYRAPNLNDPYYHVAL